MYSSNLRIYKFIFDVFRLNSKISNILHFLPIIDPSVVDFGAFWGQQFKLNNIYGTLFHWIHESTLKYLTRREKTVQKNFTMKIMII